MFLSGGDCVIYRQNSSFLRYGEYPLSSYIYTCDPKVNKGERKHLTFCNPHNHTAIEVVRVLQGRINVTVNGETFMLDEKGITIFNPLDVHYIAAADANLLTQIQVINFEMSLLENEGLAVYNATVNGIENESLKFFNLVPTEAEDGMGKIMEKIHSAFKVENSKISFAAVMAELYLMIASALENGIITQAQNVDNGNDTQRNFAKGAVHFVAENYANDISTKDIADALHLDISYFCRVFRAVFGMSFIDYLHEYRISVAKNLKCGGTVGLSHIASSVGYKNYNLFSSCFKKYVGVTPTNYYKNK